MIVPMPQDSADIPTVLVVLAEVRSGRGGDSGGCLLMPPAEGTCAQEQSQGGTEAALGLVWSKAPELQSRNRLRGVTRLPGRGRFAVPGNTLAEQGASLAV